MRVSGAITIRLASSRSPRVTGENRSTGSPTSGPGARIPEGDHHHAPRPRTRARSGLSGAPAGPHQQHDAGREDPDEERQEAGEAHDAEEALLARVLEH